MLTDLENQENLYNVYSLIFIITSVLFFIISLTLASFYTLNFVRYFQVSNVYRYFTIQKIPIHIFSILSCLCLATGCIGGLVLRVVHLIAGKGLHYRGWFKFADIAILSMDTNAIIFSLPSLSFILAVNFFSSTILVTNMKSKVSNSSTTQHETSALVLIVRMIQFVLILLYIILFQANHFASILFEYEGVQEPRIPLQLMNFFAYSYLLLVIAIFISSFIYSRVSTMKNRRRESELDIDSDDIDFVEDLEGKEVEIMEENGEFGVPSPSKIKGKMSHTERDNRLQLVEDDSGFMDEENQYYSNSGKSQEQEDSHLAGLKKNNFMNKHLLKKGDDPVASNSYQLLLAVNCLGFLVGTFFFLIRSFPLYVAFEDSWGFYHSYSVIATRAILLAMMIINFFVLCQDLYLLHTEEKKYVGISSKSEIQVSLVNENESL